MTKEIDSLVNNQTRIFKKKKGTSETEASRIKVRLAAKGFTPRGGVNFNEVFK